MERLLINPTDLKNARSIGYNHAVIENGEFAMAGQVAMDANGEIVGDDIKTQARRAYENVGHLLGAIGKDFPDVTKVTTHIVDPHSNYHDGYKDVYWETFAEPYPSHTVLGVHQLAHEDYLVEIETDLALTDADVDAIEPDGDVIQRVTESASPP
ncbi:RidA family protein [Halobacteriales archaeon SW_12_67_38]|nr:MAG: RidA family protein [Halobacteriales archaeon SW_12_67_38]